MERPSTPTSPWAPGLSAVAKFDGSLVAKIDGRSKRKRDEARRESSRRASSGLVMLAVV
jgi:hypothetical protein